MARIKDYAVTIEATTVSSSVLSMPAHDVGDLLIIHFNKDTVGGGPATPSGWTTFTANPLSSAGASNYFFAKIATSNNETVTLTYTLETAISVVISVTGYFGSTVAEAIVDVSRGAQATTLPYAGGSLTTTYDETLVIAFTGTDGGIGPITLPGFCHVYGGDSGANSLCLSYSYKKTAGSITHSGYWGGSVDDTIPLMIGIRSAATIDRPVYADLATVPSSIVTPLTGAAVIAVDNGTWQAANAVTLLTLNGKTVVGVAIATVTDSGLNPFLSVARHATTSSKTQLTASQLTFNSAQNFTTGSGILFGTWRPSIPRDYLDMGRVQDGGVYIRLADASDNNKAWLVGAQFAEDTSPSDRSVYAIQVNQTVPTHWASTGTLTNTAVNRLFVGGSGYYGACLVEHSFLYLLNETRILGGTSLIPLSFTDIVKGINSTSSNLPLANAIGGTATIWTRIIFGGVDATHINVNLSTFQFPKAYDGKNNLKFHVDPNQIGIEFYGLSGDNLTFTNCVFTSQTSYYWRFNTSHSASSNINFSGSSVVNATVTLRNTVSLSNISFISCSSFVQNSATLTNANFTDTPILCDNLSNITNGSFTSSGSGHAIILTTPGTYSLDGATFVGYGNNDTTDAVIYNNSGGAVTINASGVSGTITVRNGAGASTTVNNTVSVTITGLKDNTEVRIYSSEDNTKPYSIPTEIAGTEAATAGTLDNRSFTFSATPSSTIYIRVFNTNWIADDTRYVVPASNATIQIPQRRDRVYSS